MEIGSIRPLPACTSGVNPTSMEEAIQVTRTHSLKTWPEPFTAILEGRKRYEIRYDDRGFAVGDELELREWNPTPLTDNVYSQPAGYTNRSIRMRVLYMTPGGAWGLPAGVCVMSIEVIK